MQEEPPSLPRWISSFLRKICPDDLYEEIEGDLIQRFNNDMRLAGRKNANVKLIKNAIAFLRPGIILRNRFSLRTNGLSMIPGYFRVGSRHLLKHKVFSVINIAGLAIGITAFFLIIQYVSFEMSYDQFHSNKNELYRVALEFYENGELKNSSAENYLEVGEKMKEYLPQMKASTGFVRIPANTGFLFGYNNKLFNEGGGFFFADSLFFKVFPSLLVNGNPETALRDKHNLVVSESMAKKIFGDTDPIGQHLINVNEKGDGSDYVISGVLKDIPANAHFHASFIGVIDLADWNNLEPWRSFFHTYITLPEGTDLAAVNTRIAALNRWLNKASPNTKGAKVILQRVTDIHLESHLQDEMEAGGSKSLVFILLGIGVIILAVAWINYINIETARFVTRVKEVGIRRIIGSARSDLAIQFIIQYLMITSIAVCLAGVLLIFIIPQFHYLTGIPVYSPDMSTPSVWIGAVAVYFIGSAVAGAYPTLFLLRVDPISSLKGKTGGFSRGSGLRKTLVVVQFTVSVSLIAFLFVIFQQLEFMQLSNKRIELDKVIGLRNPTAYMNQEGTQKRQDFETLQNTLLQNSSIKGVATSSAIPGTEIGFTYVDLIKRNPGDPYDPRRYKTLFIDYNFIPVYGLKLLAGRNYSPENGEDENWQTLILNESTIRALGFKSAEEAVGDYVQFMAVDEWQRYKIVGVVEDYYHEAIKKDVYPTIFFLNHNIGQQVYYSVQLTAGANPREMIPFIEESWKKVFPAKPFEYFFLDHYYDQQFKSERHFGRIFSSFAGIATFIACLGILGMTLFEVNMRLKEISIRKVLGGSVTGLVALLSKENVRLVIVSSLLAIPLIYGIATEWLSSYPVRIELSWVIFLVPMGVLAILVVVSSGFQTVKAAGTNPVNHLKNE